MQHFILNKNQQANGDYEVHNTTVGCAWMPLPENRIDLGHHLDCRGAVNSAKQSWPAARINGCYYCCLACHTT